MLYTKCVSSICPRFLKKKTLSLSCNQNLFRQQRISTNNGNLSFSSLNATLNESDTVWNESTSGISTSIETSNEENSKDMGHLEGQEDQPSRQGQEIQNNQEASREEEEIEPEPIFYEIPESLINHFSQMIDTVKKQQVEGDLNYKCALGFPDVAKSKAAQKYWYSHLQKVFHNLANDSTWRVRQTIAGNLDILAEELDSNIIANDLVPVFLSYMEDKCDDVKLALIKILAKFFKLTDKICRQKILSKIIIFKYSESTSFWRFRAEQCSQLKYILLMIEPKQAEEFILPIAMELLTDKIAFVRKLSLSLTAEWLIKLLEKPEIEKKPTSDYSSEDVGDSEDYESDEISIDSMSSSSTVVGQQTQSEGTSTSGHASGHLKITNQNILNLQVNFDFDHYVKNQTPPKMFLKLLKKLNNLLLNNKNYQKRMLFLNLCFTLLAGCQSNYLLKNYLENCEDKLINLIENELHDSQCNSALSSRTNSGMNSPILNVHGMNNQGCDNADCQFRNSGTACLRKECYYQKAVAIKMTHSSSNSNTIKPVGGGAVNLSTENLSPLAMEPNNVTTNYERKKEVSNLIVQVNSNIEKPNEQVIQRNERSKTPDNDKSKSTTKSKSNKLTRRKSTSPIHHINNDTSRSNSNPDLIKNFGIHNDTTSLVDLSELSNQQMIATGTGNQKRVVRSRSRSSGDTAITSGSTTATDGNEGGDECDEEIRCMKIRSRSNSRSPVLGEREGSIRKLVLSKAKGALPQQSTGKANLSSKVALAPSKFKPTRPAPRAISSSQNGQSSVDTPSKTKTTATIKKSPLTNTTRNDVTVSNKSSICSNTHVTKNGNLPDEWYCWPYAKPVLNFDSIPLDQHVNVLKHPNNKKLHGIFIKYFLPNVLKLCNKKYEKVRNVRLCAARMVGLLLNVDYFVDYLLNRALQPGNGTTDSTFNLRRKNNPVILISEFILDNDEQIKLILKKYCPNQTILDAFLVRFTEIKASTSQVTAIKPTKFNRNQIFPTIVSQENGGNGSENGSVASNGSGCSTLEKEKCNSIDETTTIDDREINKDKLIGKEVNIEVQIINSELDRRKEQQEMLEKQREKEQTRARETKHQEKENNTENTDRRSPLPTWQLPIMSAESSNNGKNGINLVEYKSLPSDRHFKQD